MLAKNPSRIDDNVISEGLWALIYSIYCYNPYKGIELSTYIAWWIKSLAGAVLDKKRYASQAQELPWFPYYGSIFGKRSYKKVLLLKEEPELSDLEVIIGEKLSDYFHSLTEKPEVVSMADQTVLETEIESTVPDPKTIEDDYMDEDIYTSEYSELISRLFSDLDDIEQKIIRLHFGFEDGNSYSTYEIAKKIGKSPELVRKKLNFLLEYMRDKLEKIGFSLEDI